MNFQIIIKWKKVGSKLWKLKLEEKWNFISKLENYYRKAILWNLDKNLWYSFDNIQYKNLVSVNSPI